jgi:signal transduction histidine kinase
MQHSPRRLCVSRWLVCLCVYLSVIALPRIVEAQEQKRVLVLYSTGRDARVSLSGERALPRVLDRGLERRLDFHSEYIDAGRFSDPGYQAGFRDFLRLKYDGLQFHAVIAVLDAAIGFLETYREDLFPGTPVIFFARTAPARRMVNSTGAIEVVDFASTVTFARTLQPDARQVFVVSGAGTRERILENQARAQFKRFEPELAFTYLSGLPTRDLEQRLTNLPPQSFIYYLLVYQDGLGQAFQPVDYLDRIGRRANRPIYSWVDSTIGHGVVGGHMQRLDAVIEALAQISLRVLRGEPAESIPVAHLELTERQADWRELRRHGISEARLPPGTAVRFREPSLWERYRRYVLLAVAILLAQTALIVGLLVQAVRRRLAEEQVNRNQRELRDSSDRIRDLGRRLLGAQEEERARIARELHDDISQQLALLSMDLQVLSGFGRDADDDAEGLAREALARVDGIARSVHDLSHRLHPTKLQLVGLVAAIASLKRELSQAGVDIMFSHEGVPPTLPHDLTLCLFRIVQEALRNAIRHGGASVITVALRGGPRALYLHIADNGAGFDVGASWGRGLGLVSMSERLESQGGTLALHSRPGAGTRLEATVPLAARSIPEDVAV